jgi:hypothetical protein
VVFVAGLAFFLAGVAIVTPLLFRGRNQTVVQTVLGWALLTTMGAVPAFIFFTTVRMEVPRPLPYSKTLPSRSAGRGFLPASHCVTPEYDPAQEKKQR